MSKKKNVLVGVLLALILIAAAAGLVWHMTHYIMVGFRFYPKDAETLNLREKKITAGHYEKVSRRLPAADILWNVPFQGGYYADDTETLTITSLTDEDVITLDYLTELKTIDATGCTDYEQLLALQKRRPDVKLSYNVEIDGKTYSQDAAAVSVSDITEEEIGLLPYLTNLKTVEVTHSGNAECVTKLQEVCRENEITFYVMIGGNFCADTARKLTISGITEEEIELLQYLPELTEVHMVEPAAEAEKVIALREAYPDVDIFWEREVYGVTISSKDTEIDFSVVWPELETTKKTATATKETETAAALDLDELAEEMAYFPDAELVFLGECGLDNELLAAFREEKRAEYKVAWIVRCGSKLPTRTDATSFMPSREGVGSFKDADAYNLRYCEDMICIDVGHMDVRAVEWAAFMPELKYLILAHTGVRDITPLSNCKNLVFLELDWSPVSDFTPLQGCTALEDLNIGLTGADVTPLAEMTWLKNLWMIKRGALSIIEMTEALPNTKVQGFGSATVACGWRELPNYFKMRDALGMYYMSW